MCRYLSFINLPCKHTVRKNSLAQTVSQFGSHIPHTPSCKLSFTLQTGCLLCFSVSIWRLVPAPPMWPSKTGCISESRAWCVQTFCLPVLPVEHNLACQNVSDSTDNAVHTYTHTHTHSYTKSDADLFAVKLTDAHSLCIFISLNATLNHFNHCVKCRDFVLVSPGQSRTLSTTNTGTLYVLTDLV